MACKHRFIKINDVKVCEKCGITIDKKGRLMVFDRAFVNGRKKKIGGKR